LTIRRAVPADFAVAGLWAATAAASLAGALFLHKGAASTPACVFRSITGLACPTCGVTRAAGLLIDGRPAAALALNPLATLAGLLFVVAGLAAPLWVAFRGPVPARLDRLPRALRVVAALLFVLNWIWLVAAGV